MKLYLEAIKLLFSKFVLRKNTGVVIKQFCEKMGIVYIKLAQMLAMQNYGNLFTEKDRQMLTSICDTCNPISYAEIEEILKQEYGKDLGNIFSFIEKTPVGSASISQVHRAILKNGEEVAIKIKRKDITKTIDEDIKRIRKIVHKFGKFINFSNFTGGDHALDLYLEWIGQETDFIHERENIKIYQNFADNVNGKVSGTTQIKVPKLYEDYCTNNVIVMEFIRAKTVNKLELTDENKNKIATALNSYIRSSFWALFNGEQIVFHGDPHSGNICIDEDGNICFLDMGLLCALSDGDAKLCRKFFLAAYSGNYEKLYAMLVSYGDMNEEKKELFKSDCKRYCEEIKKKEVTYYFIDMMNVCLNYEFVPPNFLFSMAKAFVCLNGISNFSNNTCTARKLLQEQAIEFLLQRSLNDLKNMGIQITKVNFKKVMDELANYGFVKTVAKELVKNSEIICFASEWIDNLKEVRDLCKMLYSENETIMHDAKEKVKV